MSAPMLLPGRAGRDEPDAVGRGADRRRPRPLAVAAPAARRGRRRQRRARGERRARRRTRAATATRSSRRRCPGQRAEVSLHMLAPGAPPAGPDDPPMHEPGSARDGRRARGRAAAHLRRRRRTTSPTGDCRHLRLRPAAPLREPGQGADALPRRRRRRPEEVLTWRRRCSTRSGTRHEVAPTGLLYIDLHLVHEVTSPQAFESLRLAGRTRAPPGPHARHRRPQRARPTAPPRAAQIRDHLSRMQVETLEHNCASSASRSTRSAPTRQGIVHVIGPELGVTQPGMTIVCGDSHTSTHGAFGALAFGIGTSEVEHVLATQTLQQRKPRSMRDPLRGRARLRGDRQGPDPRHDRPDRRRRRRRAT